MFQIILRQFGGNTLFIVQLEIHLKDLVRPSYIRLMLEEIPVNGLEVNYTSKTDVKIDTERNKGYKILKYLVSYN
jgi:hypothetical protein